MLIPMSFLFTDLFVVNLSSKMCLKQTDYEEPSEEAQSESVLSGKSLELRRGDGAGRSPEADKRLAEREGWRGGSPALEEGDSCRLPAGETRKLPFGNLPRI
ncbi:hypothetical protein chiPu_0004739 [Chiloscyllium punctatum]|uniref:Uncharacterized protein n=1 Tax=Chiloscyllium punctatum TaxID=137246 RepID=A0A401S7E7_CHIPU|nr:hypothetical protein [Chiloscyllium punctatum]